MAEKDLVERTDEITLQQLIQHTSGIPNWFHPDVVPTFDFTTYYSPMELVKRARALPRQQEPGEMFYYSNTNYMLLGLIIEKTTNNSVAAEFKRRIFDPLKMKDTYLPTKFPGGIEGPHGHGYFPGENGKPRDIDRLNMSYGYAAGGVIGTARDISAFHRAFNKNQLLPEELKKVLAGPPRNRQPSDGASPQPSQPSQGGFCGGKIQVAPMRGTAPGFNAMTISTTDGRMQVAISVTLTIPNTDDSLQSLLSTAAEAVFCPKK